ncbi:MAG: hypothetical protein KC502_23930, partial [Myxococcales bacterium]|nr:hypothetical protein [Myxococcales bacterium]
SPAGAHHALPLADMWGGTKVGTWAHAILELLDFQPKDCSGIPVEITHAHLWPTVDDDAARSAAAQQSPFVRRGDAGQHQSAMDLATELGAQHGHQRQVDHELFVAALPQMMHAPLSVPGLAAPYAPKSGYCLAELKPADRIDELAFDMSLMGGDHWRPQTTGDRSETIDAAAVKQALSLRSSEASGPQWDGSPWIDGLLARVKASEEAHHSWQQTAPDTREPKISTILPRIAGMLTGFVDLTFRAECEDGQVRYFIADYKTNKLSSAGDRRTTRAHYTRPWLAWSMAHSNYHLQSLIYTTALHRFLSERLPGYRADSQASYDRHMGGHFYLYLRGMAGPFLPGDVHGVYADRWPFEVIDAFDRALDPDLHRRRAALAQGGDQ